MNAGKALYEALSQALHGSKGDWETEPQALRDAYNSVANSYGTPGAGQTAPAVASPVFESLDEPDGA